MERNNLRPIFRATGIPCDLKSICSPVSRSFSARSTTVISYFDSEGSARRSSVAKAGPHTPAPMMRIFKGIRILFLLGCFSISLCPFFALNLFPISE